MLTDEQVKNIYISTSHWDSSVSIEHSYQQLVFYIYTLEISQSNTRQLWTRCLVMIAISANTCAVEVENPLEMCRTSVLFIKSLTERKRNMLSVCLLRLSPLQQAVIKMRRRGKINATVLFNFEIYFWLNKICVAVVRTKGKDESLVTLNGVSSMHFDSRS